MKTLEDFKDEVSKEMGYPEYRHMWPEMCTIMHKAAERYASYVWEEACKAQKMECAKAWDSTYDPDQEFSAILNAPNAINPLNKTT